MAFCYNKKNGNITEVSGNGFDTVISGLDLEDYIEIYVGF